MRNTMTTPPKTLTLPKVDAKPPELLAKQIAERKMLQTLHTNIKKILVETKWDTLFSNPDNSLTFIEIKAKLIEAQKKIDEIDYRIYHNKQYSGDYPK